MVISGTHGTTRSRAKGILDTGFDLTKINRCRIAKGVYLYDYVHPYAVFFAECWYELKKGKGDYDSDEISNCTVLICKLKLEEDEMLDVETAQFKQKLFKIATTHGINLRDEKKISKIYGILIKETERELDCSFKVIYVRIKAPPACKKRYPTQALGDPFCFIIRDVKNLVCVENK